MGWSTGEAAVKGKNTVDFRCDNIINVKHQFMALNRVAKLNGYHSTAVGRIYKSRHLLESRHRDLSSDAINFSCRHMKGYFF